MPRCWMPASRLLLAAASAAVGACSWLEAPDLTALVQVQINTDVKAFLGVPMPSHADSHGAHAEIREEQRRAELEARAYHAARGIWFEPEVKEEWATKDVEQDVEMATLKTKRIEDGMLLNKAFEGHRSATGGKMDVIDRWIKSQQAKQESRGGAHAPNATKTNANKTNEAKNSWPIRASGNDTSAPGVVLHFVPNHAGSVSLRTEFGKWLVLRDGKMTANAPRQDVGGVNSTFFFQDHPHKERGEGNVICWKTWAGTFIGVGRDGSLQEITKMPASGDDSTKFRMARLGDDRIVLQSTAGLVVADKDANALAEWKTWIQTDDPYQAHQLELEAGRFLERFGWHRGWVVGIIVGGFIMVSIHNIMYALSDTNVDTRSRLSAFDVTRFLLEYLVIYSHLASLLGLVDWGISQWLTAYKMPSFIFITGMFGSSVAYDSIAKMLCYTLGTIIILLILRLIEVQAIWGSDQLSQQVGTHFNINEWAPGLWFLATLFVWRLTVSPMFFVARRLEKRELAVAASFVIVWVVSFLLMGWTKHFTVWIYGTYNWQHLIFFAPFFAAGLLRSPEEWDAMFRRRRVQAICAVFFVAFHVLTAISGFKQWNRSTSCLPSNAGSCFVHLYPQAMYNGVNAGAFFYDLLFFLLRLGLAVSTVCLLCTATVFVEEFLPRAVSLAAGWGSRTLYAYVIHIHMFNMLDKDGFMADITSRWADGSKFVVALIAAVVVNISLSSRGCEIWFQWFIRPYWLKDVLEWVLNGCPQQVPKSKAVDEVRIVSDLLEQEATQHPQKQTPQEDSEHPQKQPEEQGKSADVGPSAPASSSAGSEPVPEAESQRTAEAPAKP